MRIYTIGFTKSSAESFFGRIKNSGARRLIDVRLNNVSQLSGFAKRDDLRYFLRTICGVDYSHRTELAPTSPLLDSYKKEGMDWPAYERGFKELMERRSIERLFSQADLEDSCLLCSEHSPHHCHRRLVVEYLREKWGDLQIVHL